jgi:F-type H+-transporting ATPase subunit gamma
MAGGQERILRGRIKSVQSTKKITKAMELIAASRIVKAQARVAAARPYADQITAVIRNLAAGGAGTAHPLLAGRDEIRTVAFIAVTADRGLAGAYNSGVIRQVERSMAAAQAEGKATKLYTIGKKATGYFQFRSVPIEASFLGITDQPTYDQAKEIAVVVAAAFDSGEVDAVEVAYNEFLSAGSQRVVQKRLMPLDTADVEAATEGGATAAYEFEPGPDQILDHLLPRYAEARLFAAFLDASASEHAFRQRAMKAASDNADELVKTLSRIMNRARQDSITTEIMEIVGGAEAMRQGQNGAEDLLVDTVGGAQDLFRSMTTDTVAN